MERVKLRHREAEELIVKAREQAKERERQRELLKAKGRSIPPEASLLGCWQLIERTILVNADPSRFVMPTMGNTRLFFTVLTPDRRVFGTGVAIGTSTHIPSLNASHEWKDAKTSDIDGRIVGGGHLMYRSTPTNQRWAYVSGSTFIVRPPSVTDARWEGWEMEGEVEREGGGHRVSFKAVRIDDPTLEEVGHAFRS